MISAIHRNLLLFRHCAAHDHLFSMDPVRIGVCRCDQSGDEESRFCEKRHPSSPFKL